MTGAELKALRKARDKSLRQAAIQVGVHWRTWARWETHTRVPEYAWKAFEYSNAYDKLSDSESRTVSIA